MKLELLIQKLRNPEFAHGGTSAPYLPPIPTIQLMREAADKLEQVDKALKAISVWATLDSDEGFR